MKIYRFFNALGLGNIANYEIRENFGMCQPVTSLDFHGFPQIFHKIYLRFSGISTRSTDLDMRDLEEMIEFQEKEHILRTCDFY